MASRLKADLKAERRTVIALEQMHSRKQVLQESEQNKVEVLELAQDQKQGQQDTERQILFTKLETKASILEGARAEVVILSGQAKKRDLMLSLVLESLDSITPRKLQNEAPIVGAKAHLSAHAQKIGADVFGSLTEEKQTAKGTLARPAFGGLSLSNFLLLNRLGMFWAQSLYASRSANSD
jgi:hypothetical protein